MISASASAALDELRIAIFCAAFFTSMSNGVVVRPFSQQLLDRRRVSMKLEDVGNELETTGTGGSAVRRDHEDIFEECPEPAKSVTCRTRTRQSGAPTLSIAAAASTSSVRLSPEQEKRMSGPLPHPASPMARMLFKVREDKRLRIVRLARAD
jgi:hypothetical protein